jgi:hypothetical protein
MLRRVAPLADVPNGAAPPIGTSTNLLIPMNVRKESRQCKGNVVRRHGRAKDLIHELKRALRFGVVAFAVFSWTARSSRSWPIW